MYRSNNKESAKERDGLGEEYKIERENTVHSPLRKLHFQLEIMANLTDLGQIGYNSDWITECYLLLAHP